MPPPCKETAVEEFGAKIILALVPESESSQIKIKTVIWNGPWFTDSGLLHPDGGRRAGNPVAQPLSRADSFR